MLEMRLFITGLAIGTLLTGLAGSTDVSAQESKKYRNYDNYDDYYDRDRRDAYRAFRRLVPGYQARNPDNFRFGSDEWWKAMDAEGRGGHSRF
jgi:hypothetical protein